MCDVVIIISDELKTTQISQICERYPDLTDRINYYSACFLGKPYVLGAQGEGPDGEFDQAPLCRFDAFDCVTHVNDVLALAMSAKQEDFIQNLLRINYYHADAKFENRFHFMSCDWNVQNQQNGIVKDITRQVCDPNGKSIALEAVGDIDKPGWYRFQEKPIPNNANIELARISYVPLTAMFDANKNPDPFIFSQIPHTAIIEIVRPNWDLVDKIGTRLHVSHLGFAILNAKNELSFRHASSEQKAVVEVSLMNYLQGCLSSPTIKGINIQVTPEK